MTLSGTVHKLLTRDLIFSIFYVSILRSRMSKMPLTPNAYILTPPEVEDSFQVP